MFCEIYLTDIFLFDIDLRNRKSPAFAHRHTCTHLLPNIFTALSAEPGPVQPEFGSGTFRLNQDSINPIYPPFVARGNIVSGKAQ